MVYADRHGESIGSFVKVVKFNKSRKSSLHASLIFRHLRIRFIWKIGLSQGTDTPVKPFPT